MLGEKLGELQGKVTGQRVLSSEGSGRKMETSLEIRGTILGVEAAMLGTYWSTVRPDGSLYGECPMQGILTTAGGEVGTWTAAGVGRFTGALLCASGSNQSARSRSCPSPRRKLPRGPSDS